MTVIQFLRLQQKVYLMPLNFTWIYLVC